MLVTVAMILAVSQSASAATPISAATDPVADARFEAPVLVESVIATRSVDGQANIFAAGRSAVPSDTDGILPPVVPVDGAELVTFPSVSGTFSCCSGSLANGPDGGRLQDVFDPCCAVDSYRGIGGIHDYSVEAPAGGYLVGVFLDDTTPAAPAPAVLDFTDAHDFAELAPGLRQVFFIGDGRDDAGDLQRFRVPSGATRLFLGFSDGCGARGGAPGCYYDNTGGFVASVSGATSGGTFQPDALIKRSRSATYVGDGIYNTTGQNQRVTGRVLAGNSATFNIKVQNDGSTDDPMRLAGCSRSSGFVVKYFTSRGDDITADVVAGTQVTRTLPAGGQYRFIMRIRAKLIAASEARKACTVIATSVGDATTKDAVRATLIVR